MRMEAQRGVRLTSGGGEWAPLPPDPQGLSERVLDLQQNLESRAEASELGLGSHADLGRRISVSA